MCVAAAGLLPWCPAPNPPSESAAAAAALLPHVALHATGLGVLSALSDELMLAVLELLPAPDLARLGLASKALYCFAHTADLWKGLVLQVCRCFLLKEGAD